MHVPYIIIKVHIGLGLRYGSIIIMIGIDFSFILVISIIINFINANVAIVVITSIITV